MSEWTDEDGNALGQWFEITREHWIAEVQFVGGLEAMRVFSTLTDPNGNYGTPMVYTAWGLDGEDVPLVDVRDYKRQDGATDCSIFRMFVRAAPSNQTSLEV